MTGLTLSAGGVAAWSSETKMGEEMDDSGDAVDMRPLRSQGHTWGASDSFQK